jgi:hypothetical protein
MVIRFAYYMDVWLYLVPSLKFEKITLRAPFLTITVAESFWQAPGLYHSSWRERILEIL